MKNKYGILYLQRKSLCKYLICKGSLLKLAERQDYEPLPLYLVIAKNG